MKTLVCEQPGILQYADIPAPVAKEGETLLRIHRVGICGTDLHIYEGTQPFFSYPGILGHELAGEIVSTTAPGFGIGEAVTVIPYFNCGTCIACRSGKPNCCAQLRVCGVHIDGGMAEYYTVPSCSLVHGNGLTMDELALVEPLAIGAHGVRRAGIRPGEFVLVVGAGPIGLGVMEFARLAGGKVIALDVQASRLSFCAEKLQVPYTINGTSDNVAEKLADITSGDMPAVIIDATGSLKAINQSFHYLAHGGRYVLVGLQKEAIVFSHPEFHKREAGLYSSRNATREDFEWVMNCLQTGAVNPLTYITHRVGLEDVTEHFPGWLDPANGVIKAMVNLS